ncbi:MAG: LPP20 family lipoprotein [Fibrobacterales bacterium]
MIRVYRQLKAVAPMACILLFFMSNSWATPSWVDSGELDSYPKSRFISAVGRSTKSLDEARQNAQVAVQQQIVARVSSTSKQKLSEVSINDASALSDSFSKSARVSVSGEIKGIEIVKTTEGGGIFYAFAALNKNSFASNLSLIISEKNSALKESFLAAQRAYTEGELRVGGRHLEAAKGMISEIEEQRVLLGAVAQLSSTDEVSVSYTQIGILQENALLSTSLEIISGSNQILDGTNSPEPIVVKLTMKGKEVRGVHLMALNALSRKESNAITNDTGIAEFSLNNLSQESGKQTYTIQIDSELAGSYSEIVKEKALFVSYEVKPKSCAIDLHINNQSTVSNDKVEQGIEALFKKYGIVDKSGISSHLNVTVESSVVSEVQGVSAGSSFVKVKTSLTVKARKEKNAIGSTTMNSSALAKGEEKAVLNAIKKSKLSEKFHELHRELCK